MEEPIDHRPAAKPPDDPVEVGSVPAKYVQGVKSPNTPPAFFPATTGSSSSISFVVAASVKFRRWCKRAKSVNWDVVWIVNRGTR